MNTERIHDVVVIGAGPSGSTAASMLAKQNIDVCIVEKENFPRFKIGESLLPYSMDIFRKTGVFETLDSGQFMRKYGAQFIDWRESDEVYFVFEHGLDSDHPFSFEVSRAEFDKVLFDHAQKLGVKSYQPETVEKVLEGNDDVQIITNKGTIRCKYVMDCSGREAFLGKQSGVRTRNIDFNNIGVFSHFKNVKRNPGKQEGDIIIGILPNKRWSWMIPFKDGIASVGIVADAREYRGMKLDENFIRESLSVHPKLKSYMENAEILRPVQSVSNYSEVCSTFIGRRWIMAGDAACFLDPVFSTGVHVGLKSADFAADVVLESLSKNIFLSDSDNGRGYEAKVKLGVNRFRSLLKMFYDTDFVPSMKKAMTRKHVMQSFTSVVGGDAWNDKNELFIQGVMGGPQ